MFALAIHGGAGPARSCDYSVVESHLENLATRGKDALQQGRTALDVVEMIVREMEASGLYIAGKGSGTNRSGYVELDASIMDGASRRAGGVAALRDIVHPISAARKVMETTPHVLLVGAGATHFALKSGLEFVDDPGSYYVGVGPVSGVEGATDTSHGTVGATALDREGRLASATSSGGLLGKLEGRVGDTPLIGAGTWADRSVAVSCTGKGESFILAGGAREVAARVSYRKCSLQEAAEALLEEVASLGGSGGLIAVSSRGEIAIAFNTPCMPRATVSAVRSTEVSIFKEA